MNNRWERYLLTNIRTLVTEISHCKAIMYVCTPLYYVFVVHNYFFSLIACHVSMTLSIHYEILESIARLLSYCQCLWFTPEMYLTFLGH